VRRTGPYGTAAAGAWEALMKFAYSRRLMTKETLLIGISHDDPSITPEEWNVSTTLRHLPCEFSVALFSS
jgi:AraC family transcriptional regulator